MIEPKLLTRLHAADAELARLREALRKARPYVEEGAVASSIEFTEESAARSAAFLEEIDALAPPDTAGVEAYRREKRGGRFEAHVQELEAALRACEEERDDWKQQAEKQYARAEHARAGTFEGLAPPDTNQAQSRYEWEEPALNRWRKSRSLRLHCGTGAGTQACSETRIWTR